MLSKTSNKYLLQLKLSSLSELKKVLRDARNIQKLPKIHNK